MSRAHARFPIEEARKILDEGLPFGPRTHPCVCGAGRHAHGGTTNGGRCPETGCRRYRPDMAYQLAYTAADAQQERLGTALRRADRLIGQEHRKARPLVEGQWRIGVSDVDTCPKAIEYRNKPPEDFVPAWEDKREAMVGTMIHEAVEERLRLVYPWREFEEWIEVPGLDREGRYDWYDGVTQEAGDTKTAGSWRWDRIGDHGPDEDTWLKVQLYALSLIESGKPVKTVCLEYLKRDNGHDESFRRPFDRKAAETARDRLLGYATALDLGMPLERAGEGPDRDPLCKRCFARNHCWSIPQAEAAGRSAYSFTYLGPTPEDEHVALAVQQLVDARAVEKAGKDAKEQAADLLHGVEPGRYGEFEGYTKSGGGGDDWKAYASTLERLFELPEGMRPALDKIPIPQKRKFSYVMWGRVRKATLQREAKAQSNGAA